VRGLGALMIGLMRPVGRAGRVRAVGDDPFAHPAVSFDLLADRRDVDGLVGGVRTAMDLLRRPAFREIVREVYVDAHGTTMAALGDDQALERWVRASAGEYLHASCTCAMGRVVDEDGAVFGSTGLYVCDASVFPQIPDVNTHLPAVSAVPARPGAAQTVAARSSSVASCSISVNAHTSGTSSRSTRMPKSRRPL
jgi:choline dehydrogenase